MSKITVYHNPQCERCRRIAQLHKRFDWLHRISISTATPPSGPLAMGEIAVNEEGSKIYLKGVDSVRMIARQVPAYWPLLPLLKIPFISKKVDQDVRGCKDGACAV